jgi:hypothetical protein
MIARRWTYTELRDEVARLAGAFAREDPEVPATREEVGR